MSEVDGRFVKRGLWTNLDQGEIMGKTITTDSTTGTIVVAVMAIMCTVGTSHLWSLLVFGYHQMRADGRPADGLFRQQQSLLRTIPPPSSLMAESVKLWWLWRHGNKKVLSRSLPQFLLATLCTAGFIAAGISSSFVVSNSNLQVLVQSPHCGYLNESMPTSAWREEIAVIRAVSGAYAQECYTKSTLTPSSCGVFVRPTINYTIERVSCPFDTTFCTTAGLKSSPAVAIDSGLVDLNHGFGLNLPVKDRVSYRRRTVCAVMPLEGRTKVINASEFPAKFRTRDIFPGEEYMLFLYGNNRWFQPEGWTNVSDFVSLLELNISRRYAVSANLYVPAQEAAGKGNTIYPLPGLLRQDADVAIINLVGDVDYFYPVDDPWFAAHRPVSSLDPGTRGNTTSYKPDNPVSPMGCTIQHQYCYQQGSGQRCLSLGGMPFGVDSEDWKGASPVQLAAIQVLITANKLVPMASASDVRASRFLLPRGGVTSQIPPDQWIKEVEGFDSVVWAALQTLISDYAVGPSVRTAALAEHIIKPTNQGATQLCGAQKMRKSGGFVNINVFGLAFVVATSMFFAVLDILLLKFLIFLESFKRILSPRIDRWIQDGVWQLQRRAHEAHGEGTWSRLLSEVPLTKAGEILADLPLESVTLPQTTSSIKPGVSRSISSRTTPSRQTLQAAPSESADSLQSELHSIQS